MATTITSNGFWHRTETDNSNNEYNSIKIQNYIVSLQVTVECKGPQVPPAYVTKVTDFLMANQPPNSKVALRWSSMPATDDPEPVDVSSRG